MLQEGDETALLVSSVVYRIDKPLVYRKEREVLCEDAVKWLEGSTDLFAGSVSNFLSTQ